MKLYAGALAAVLAAGITIWIVLGQQRVNEHLVQHTDEVLLRLANVLADVVDSETAERGYVITGSKASLQPYEEARHRLTEDLDSLRALVADNLAEVARVEALHRMVLAEESTLATMIASRSTAAVIAGDDKRQTDSIRTQIDEMRSAEVLLLADRQAAAGAADRTTVTIVVAMLAVLLFGLAYAARTAQINATRRRIDDFREQFLGTVGHDLRAPLTAISIEAQMLRRDQDPTGERILASTARMTNMVDQLLDVTRSRLGSGIPIALRSIELRAVVETIAREHARAYPDRVVVAPGPPVTGMLDADRIGQVISNLVGNALAHGRGVTDVTLTERDRTAVLRVHNEGTPISASEIPHLFEPFRARGESQGLGLGLFIADEIVRGHGGVIDVTSTDLGTTFEVRLPLDRHAA